LSARYPLSNEWRINPRCLGYQLGDTTDLREVTILPSILINYYWTRDLSLELEVGAKWTERQQAGATQTETDLFFTAGFRYASTPMDKSRAPCSRPAARALAHNYRVAAVPRITVACEDSTPPLPCAMATSQSLTCRAPHSPRNCRTASISKNRPYMPGWQ